MRTKPCGSPWEDTFEWLRQRIAGILPHDFTHSWNGKYRESAGLATPNYQVPTVDSAMWVNEGLANYFGGVLAVRSGIWTPDQYMGSLAETAARYEHRPGMTWRDMEDTATMATILFGRLGPAYDNWRRGADFYDEGQLVWLDIDATIRNKTHGRKSLNDFAAAFHGGGHDTGPETVPYTLDDLVAALNAVAPNDWADFLNQRLHGLAAGSPLGGIRASGYRLVYRDKPNAWTTMLDDPDSDYSVAMSIVASGTVVDVLKDCIAYKAGFAPGMKVLEVNGKPYTTAVLRQAVRNAKGTATPIACKVQNTGVTKMLQLDYHGGEQFPVLERVEGTPDRIGEILQPMKG